MSKKISKLFLTRGVPGTHDTKTLYNCLKRLKNKKFSKMLIPKFDKSNDDRCKKNRWTKILKKPDIIIFEGWCVGAKPQKKKDLLRSINALERTSDKNLIWRKKVNQELKGKYKKIYNLIDDLIFLKVPSFNYVYKWRMLQEKKLKLSSNGNKIMDKKELKKFVMYYERITKHMFRTLTNKVKFTIFVDESHKFKSIKFN